ncbi:MAG: methionine aminotransferase [Crocinitomicaceae bacterium]
MQERFFPSKLPNVGTTIFSTMSALAKEQGAINLSQGFPDFPIDSDLKTAVEKALKDEQVQYAPMPGRMDLREQLSAKIFVQHGVAVDPKEEITIHAGATQAIYSAIAASVHKGDEVVLFDPAYDCYAPSIRLHGGIPIHLKLTFPDYRINWSEVSASITEKTRMIIVNNPHNPAGTVWQKNDITALEKIVQQHPQLLILSDEVYEHIQFEGEHQSVLKSELLRKRSFVCYSFGKTFHVTGWKIGYCVAPLLLTKELRKMHQFNVFCVNNTMQSALNIYLSEKQAWMQVSEGYKKKRDLFLEGMKHSRFKALNCEGTYFCLFDYSDISTENDVDFCKHLTQQYKVAAIPVSVFYQDQTDHKVIRFCFAKEDETLTKATQQLCRI